MALVISEEIFIDCDDLSCINFSDKTKEYSLNNLNGYGGPNVPSLGEIMSVTFIIIDENLVEWVFIGSTYLPNAAGTSTVCLRGTDFVSGSDTLVFVGGKTYTLQYVLNLGASVEVEATPQDFLFPCCGGTTVSSLATNFKATEKLGCSSFDFKDTTGSYNVMTNPGGYGAPNPPYSAIVSTLIKITRADGTVIQITDFIPTINNQTRNITAAQLGYVDGLIIPQIMTIEYSVFVAGICRVGYKSTEMLFHCAIRNCIVAKGKSVVVQSCKTSCDTSEMKLTISLIHRYEMMLLASKENMGCVAGEIEALYEECKQFCGSCP